MECVEHVKFPAFRPEGCTGDRLDLRNWGKEGQNARPDTAPVQILSFEGRLTMMERGMAIRDPFAALTWADLLVDFASAAAIMLPAAESGSSAAECHTGRFYESGRGIAQDLQAAERWYRRAAETGLPDAMAILGNLCSRRAAAAWASETGEGGGEGKGGGGGEGGGAEQVEEASAAAQWTVDTSNCGGFCCGRPRAAASITGRAVRPRQRMMASMLAGGGRGALDILEGMLLEDPVCLGGVAFDPAGPLQSEKQVLRSQRSRACPSALRR